METGTLRSIATWFRSAHADDNGFGPRPGYVPFGREEAEGTLGDRFRWIARRRGDAPAVFNDEGVSVSYSELLARAERLGGALQVRVRSNPAVIGILHESGLETIVSMLGALLGGFAYLCIEPSLPVARLAAVLDAANPAVLLADEASTARLLSAWSHSVGRLMADPAAAELQAVPGNPGNIAALYATSGSTGEPKIVALSHRAILFDIGRQINDLFLGPDDRFDSLFPFAFSASLATIFGALFSGGELHPHNPKDRMLTLLEWLEDRRITISTMTVSMMRHLCWASSKVSRCPSLRLLFLGGEMLAARDAEQFFATFASGCVLQNAMASTETRTYAQYFLPRGVPLSDPLPIGWPVAGKEVVLLEDGEIGVCSEWLATGYSNDPGLTSRKFTVSENGAVLFKTGDRGHFCEDGSLIFSGRMDSLVKIRGYRVEMKAVEAAIARHPAIRNVAIARHDTLSGTQLAAYVVATGVTEGEIRAFLSSRLPEYAIPATFCLLDKLPTLPNGKIDYRNLPEPIAATQPVPATDSMIGLLSAIWREVLGCGEIAPDDDFFALGGNSLSAVRVLVKASQQLGRPLAAAALVRFPTLQQLASHLEHTGWETALVPFHPEGSGCPVFLVHAIGGTVDKFRGLAARLRPHSCFGLSAWLQAPASIETMAAAYVTEVRATTPSARRVVLIGYSLGGLIVYEMARILDQSGGPEALVVVIDMPVLNVPGLRQRSWLKEFCDAVLNFPRWSLHAVAQRTARDLGSLAGGHLNRIARGSRTDRNKRDKTEFEPAQYFGLVELPADYKEFITAVYQAMYRYRPGRHAGRVVLLRARVPSLFRDRDQRMGWHLLADGGVEVHEIPGAHHECLDEPHTKELSEVVLRVIAAHAAPER